MITRIWQLLSAIFDVKSHFRSLKGKERLDVVFISNMRDDLDRKRGLGGSKPKDGHFNGPRISYKNINGRVRGIDSTAAELYTLEGRKKAKKQFIAATSWAESNGAKVVLMAASTKRLFGRNGSELKKKFPKILFTIGDNGTAVLLLYDIKRKIKELNKSRNNINIVVIGPYGILGNEVVKYLTSTNYNVIGIGSNKTALDKIGNEFNITTSDTFENINNIDLIVACTHSKTMLLKHDTIKNIKRKNSKIFIIDVAEPSNFTKEEFLKSSSYSIRQDAGNAYSPHINYVLGSISYKLFRLSKGVVFGCFAEAIALSYLIKTSKINNVNKFDLFHIQNKTMKFISHEFKDLEISSPSPTNFGYNLTPNK